MNSKSYLEGTFIQPEYITAWDSEQFDRHFIRYREILFDHIILQWIESRKDNDDTAVTYYQSSLPGRVVKKDLLGNLLTYGRKHRIKIYIGLNTNDKWWEVISKTPREFNRWMAAETDISREIVDDIWSKYGVLQEKSEFYPIAGWYSSFEVDNLNFNSSEKQNILARHYNLLNTHIKRVSGLPLMISPFFNRALDIVCGPNKWKEMWANILSQADVDIIALQDGIGCRREIVCEDKDRTKAIKNVGKWFKATRDAIDYSGRNTELWSDLETFVEEIEDGRSKFNPAPIDRIIKQIKAERRHVDKFTSFSFQAYQDYDRNIKLFNRYREYVEDISSASDTGG